MRKTALYNKMNPTHLEAELAIDLIWSLHFMSLENEGAMIFFHLSLQIFSNYLLSFYLILASAKITTPGGDSDGCIGMYYTDTKANCIQTGL